MKKQPATSKPIKHRSGKQVFPRGWNGKGVQDVIDYYDNQTEDEGVAEYEAAMQVEDLTVMFVPTDLVPEIRQLIDRRRGA
jgi:hypothetical protein